MFGTTSNNNTVVAAAATTNVEWKENEERQALPLSMNVRRQLLQLEQVIAQSENPQATLEQVAQQNQMSANELAQMLTQNRHDIDVGGVDVSPTNLRKELVKTVGSIFLLVKQWQTKHPRAFWISTASVLGLLYVSMEIPRTGLVLSSSNGLVSKGHTTWREPPSSYIDRILDRTITEYDDADDGGTSISRRKRKNHQKRRINKGNLPEDWTNDDLWEGINVDKNINTKPTSTRRSDDDDAMMVQHHKLPRRSNKSQAVSITSTMAIHDFMPKVDNEDEDEELLEGIMESIMDVASDIVSQRRFSEFVDDTLPLRIQSNKSGSSSRRSNSSNNNKKDFAVLVLPKAGDWGGFALQKLHVTESSTTKKNGVMMVTYETLPGGIANGYLQVAIQPRYHKRQQQRRRDENEDDPSVTIQILWVTPKKGGRKLPVHHASVLLSTMAQSITKSIQTEVQRLLKRNVQSQAYRKMAQARAKMKRSKRLQLEEQMEEMAADRRRRWQRANPDAGRYRPSNRRQQSPNNC